MKQQVYLEMLGVMKSRQGPYAGLDIPEFYGLVRELFTPQEAEVNNALGKQPETLEQIAHRIQQNQKELSVILESMADKGLCATFIEDGLRFYKGLPFMPGIFEYQFISGRDSARERKLAKLIDLYKKAHDRSKGVTKITFPVTRVIPVDRTINTGNHINTYDQVATYIQKYDSIGVGACYCRHAAKLRGEDTYDMPIDVCMWFGKAADYMIERVGGKKVTKKEAMVILDRTEKAGLIHMSRNTTEDIEFLCNCDRWHCEIVTHVLKQDKPGMVFNSGYMPVFDSNTCSACATCIDRCPSQALTLSGEQLPEVNLDRCFGCAVCATGCPEEAIAMEAKPEYPEPPRTVKELIAGLKTRKEL